jgi:DNA polymerase-3 subunit delta'
MKETLPVLREKFIEAVKKKQELSVQGGFSDTQTFKFLEEDLSRLEKAAEMNAHAYLLDSEERVGVEFARYLFALKNCPSFECHKCNVCSLIFSKEVNLDFILVSPQGSEILSEQVLNDVIRFSYEKSVEVPVKFLVIEEAHLLNVESSNLLLKTLEEPPLSTNFVLITSKPDALLETVQSRCVKIKLKSRMSEVSAELLRYLLDEFFSSMAELRGLHDLDRRIKDAVEAYAESRAAELKKNIEYLERLELDKKQKKRMLALATQRYERLKKKFEKELIMSFMLSILRILNLYSAIRADSKIYLGTDPDDIEFIRLLEREVDLHKNREIMKIIEKGIELIQNEVKPEYVLKGVILKTWKVITA